MRAHICAPLRSSLQLPALWCTAFLALGLCTPAHAVDGCKVLLCMAGNWKNISQCEPTVRQALRDVARGHDWPECDMGGNSGAHAGYLDPRNCPEQYRIVIPARVSWEPDTYACPFNEVVDVSVDGKPWSRTYTGPADRSVVEWFAAARLAYADTPEQMDETYERDLAVWKADQARIAAVAAQRIR